MTLANGYVMCPHA